MFRFALLERNEAPGSSCMHLSLILLSFDFIILGSTYFWGNYTRETYGHFETEMARSTYNTICDHISTYGKLLVNNTKKKMKRNSASKNKMIWQNNLRNELEDWSVAILCLDRYCEEISFFMAYWHVAMTIAAERVELNARSLNRMRHSLLVLTPSLKFNT